MDDVEEILNEYSSLVRSIVKSACYSSSAIDASDLYQIGEIAVLRAVKLYNPSYGANIRSFVARIVKQDVYNEAARFLGVFTVDRRVTGLASKVTRMHDKGMSDEEIADKLTSFQSRNFDADHIRDLRLAYSRRQHVYLCEDTEYDNEYHNIKDILDSVIKNETDEILLNNRILGLTSVDEVATILSVKPKEVYRLEADLKDRIRIAVRNWIE